MQQQARSYRFADFTLDLARRRLSGNGQDTLPLTGRAFDVLAYLLLNRERMVSKRELMDAVWPQAVVEDNNLTQAISVLRRVLGDSRETPQFIATIAGRGYQFVGQARPVGEAAPEADVAAVPLAAPPLEIAPMPPPAAPPVQVAAPPAPVTPPAKLSRRGLLAGAGAAAVATVAGAAWLLRPRPAPRLPASIAVLPFKPLLGNAGNAAIEIGVAELLINRLSNLPDVVVKPLSSVRRFSAAEQDPLQAGRELGVAAVVDGYVQIEQGNVRLTARLLDVASGQSLWAGNYTETLGDFFAVQDSLVTQLVNALAVDLSPEARQRLTAHSTVDPEAWQLYANGRYHLDRRDPEGIVRARNYFDAAITRDPRFALAVTGLSEAWALAGTFALQPPVAAFEQARQAANRALKIDPALPQALVAMGHVMTQLDHDWEGGRRLYRQALSLAPNTAWAHSFLALNVVQSGRVETAIEAIGRAQSLEPAAIGIMAVNGFIRYHARQFEVSRRQLEAVLQSAPTAVLPRQFLARTLLALGDARGVIRLLEGRNDTAPGSFSSLARAYAMVGNSRGLQAEIERVEREGTRGFGVGFDLALVHLAASAKDRALESLERALGDHSQMIGYINVEPALDPLRNEPRVREIARQIGLA
jgi:DNA-binding winged helix-turn-helix (wHTH) protein/TolB-like protein